MASRGSLHPADAFCYVRGQFIKTKARKYSMKACRKMCEAYKTYYGMPVGDQDKSWAPHFTCEYCTKTLEDVPTPPKRDLPYSGDTSQSARKILEIQITFSQMH